MQKTVAAMVLALSVGAQGALAQQRITAEMLRGEWLGKVDGLASPTDAGERGFRFFAALGTDGVGWARYVANGKASDDLMNLTVENDSVTFSTRDRAKASLKLIGPGEMSGTWTAPAAAPAKVTLKRTPPATAFDRTYAGRADSPGTNQCVSYDMKIAIKDGHVTGNMGYTYFSYNVNFDIAGEAWSNGDVDFTVVRTGQGFVGYFRGKLEASRFKTQWPSSTCGTFEFNLR